LSVIDLNSDLGESFGPWVMGADEEMMALVSSANIACGGHASDPETMYRTIELARQHRVVVGAHPGYPDLMNFGRRTLPFTPDEVQRFCVAQIGSLMAMAKLAGTRVSYVKPHGALANVAADDRTVAEAIARGIEALGGLAVLAISGTELDHVARARGLPTYSEIFADRGYTKLGRLVPRTHPRAMLTDPEEAAERLLSFFRTGLMPTIDGPSIPLEAHSICIHGDSRHAVGMARHVRQALSEEGIVVRSFIER
jgi:5-oxoprolinase (ATP-hydrolysing) subunit A